MLIKFSFKLQGTLYCFWYDGLNQGFSPFTKLTYICNSSQVIMVNHFTSLIKKVAAVEHAGNSFGNVWKYWNHQFRHSKWC